MASKLVTNHVCDRCLVKAHRDTNRKAVADFGRTFSAGALRGVRFLCRDCWQATGIRCDAWMRRTEAAR